MFSRTRLFICLPPRPLYKLRKLYSSSNISVSMYYFFVNFSIDKAWKEHIQILHHTLWICYISYLQKVILNIARRSVSRLIRLIRDRIANSSSFTKSFAEAPVQVFIICLNNCWVIEYLDIRQFIYTCAMSPYVVRRQVPKSFLCFFLSHGKFLIISAILK